MSPADRARILAVGIVLVSLLAASYAFVRAVMFPEPRASSSDDALPLVANVDSSPTVSSVALAANALSAFTLEQSATPGTDVNDKYVTEGLRLLAAVVGALIVRDSLVSDVHVAALQEMLAEAERLERSTESTILMTTTRAAFVSAAELVTVLQRRKHPHLAQATTRLRDAARAIRLNRPLRQQSVEVEVFFLRASDAVQGMATVQL